MSKNLKTDTEELPPDFQRLPTVLRNSYYLRLLLNGWLTQIAQVDRKRIPGVQDPIIRILRAYINVNKIFVSDRAEPYIYDCVNNMTYIGFKNTTCGHLTSLCAWKPCEYDINLIKYFIMRLSTIDWNCDYNSRLLKVGLIITSYESFKRLNKPLAKKINAISIEDLALKLNGIPIFFEFTPYKWWKFANSYTIRIKCPINVNLSNKTKICYHINRYNDVEIHYNSSKKKLMLFLDGNNKFSHTLEDTRFTKPKHLFVINQTLCCCNEGRNRCTVSTQSYFNEPVQGYYRWKTTLYQ